jgi:hypothetical protein
LLSVLIAAQRGGFEELVDDLVLLHRRAGDARRAIEAAGDASEAAA